MSNRFTVAAVQLRVGNDKSANLAVAERLVGEAAARGARLVSLPELFSWGGRREEEAAAAETIPGPTSDRVAELAAGLGIYLVAGSILERADGTTKAWNTCCVFDPSGKSIATYRKIHLFDVAIADRVAVRESDTRLAGDRVEVAICDRTEVGLAICYDLRFPELFRRLVDRDAKLICMPSAFTMATGAVHWESLVRARAIENQVYLIAPNQYGRGGSGVLNYGNSMIVDPWGTVLARCGDGDGVIFADIDLDYLTRVRQEIPCLEHRVLRG